MPSKPSNKTRKTRRGRMAAPIAAFNRQTGEFRLAGSPRTVSLDTDRTGWGGKSRRYDRDTAPAEAA